MNDGLRRFKYSWIIHAKSIALDTALFAALSTGFLLGLEHSFEPDHVVAVSTIVTQRRGIMRSLLTGSFWGLGHTVVIIAVGLLVVILKVELQSEFFELLAGVMLIGLGVWTIWNLKKNRIHIHTHAHDGKRHFHLHSHARDAESHDHMHLPFLAGLVQGFAGSGALVVLVMSTMGSFVQALLFVVIFGGALILGMSIIGSGLSLPLNLNSKWRSQIGPVASMITSILSIILGIIVIASRL